MRTLIVDDERATRTRLKRLLASYPEIDVIAEAENGLQAAALLKTRKPDLVFLDIHMPGLDGFDVLRTTMFSDPKPLVIFVTGHEQHALEAFQADALSYLLKPIDKDKLNLAVTRALALRRPVMGIPKALHEEPVSKIVGRKLNQIVLLDPSNILWFGSFDGRIVAQSRQDMFEVNHQLVWLERFAGKSFFRARRTLLVNLDHVVAIRTFDRSAFKLIMDDARSTEWLVSERQARVLRLRLPGL